MHSQLFVATGALLYLATTVSGVPALQFSDTEQYCGVTTIYVTVSPTSSTIAAPQLSKISAGDYGRVSNPFPAASTESGVSGTILGSSIGVGSISTTQLTSTVYQTVWLTNYMTGSGITQTETVQVTYPVPPSIPFSTFTQAAAGEASTSSGGILVASISSVTVAQSTSTADGDNDSTTTTLKTQQECSGDLLICSETSVLHSLTSSSVQSKDFPQLTSSTSSIPEVYIVETLTVIPLESILSTSSSFVIPIGLTTQSGATSAITVNPISVVVSIPIMTSVTSPIASPTTALGSPSLDRASAGSGGWNMSVASSSVNESLAVVGTAFSTTLDVAALSTGRPSTPSVSSELINFSNSYLFPNMTSTLVAKPGFTISLTSSPPSFISFSAGSSTLVGFQSLASIPSSLPTATGTSWTESCSGTNSSSSTVDALQSTVIGFSASMTVTTSSPLSSSPTTTISAITWTESCIKNNSSTSTANAVQYTIASATGRLSTGLPLIVSSSTRTFWNYTNSSSPLNGFVTSSSSTSIARSAQSAFSSFTASILSSFSSAPSHYSLKNSYNLTSTTTANMTATPSLATSFFSTISKSPISSGTSKASPLNTTSSSLPTSSPSSTFETSQGTTSLLFSATPTLSTPIHSTSASATSPAEDTCTDSAAIPSSFTASSTPTSSVLTFITMASNSTLTAPSSDSVVGSITTLTATSTSSPSPASSTCGDYGAFTLNFDDLPPLSVKDNATADPMPLFSPYHQFYFSAGWTIVPPPTDPYLPSSRPLLVEFLADPGSALGYTGAVGNGANALLGCFNFNVLGVSLGCDSRGPDCDWQFTGLRYNTATRATDTITSQSVSTAACAALANCTLAPVVLDGTFRNLTEFRVNVTVSGVEKIWWLDDLNLSWSDDSCDAGLCRAQQV